MKYKVDKIGNRVDLASVTGLLLKACPILKESLPHAAWLEYLHTARYTTGKLRGKERGIAADAANCCTVEEAVGKAECLSRGEISRKRVLWWE